MTEYIQISPAPDTDAPQMRRLMFADQAMREDGADLRDILAMFRRYADLIEREINQPNGDCI